MQMRQPSRPTLLSGLILSAGTILVCFLLVEGLLQWTWKKNPYQWDRRLMFFSEGRNFENKDWGGLAYQANALVRAQTYYITSLDPPTILKEYDYNLTTNRHGFVQLGEVTDTKPAILLLGNSYTEGQGAHPWFYGMEKSWPQSSRFQLINGGVWGSGVESWGALYRDVSGKIHVAKVVIVFISADWNRPLFQLPERTLDCLRVAAKCDGSEGFYGLPEDSNAAKTQIDRVVKFRIDQLSARQRNSSIIERTALYQRLLEPSYRRLKWFLHTGNFRGVLGEQFVTSSRVAAELVNHIGRDNVLFIHLPQKDEIGSEPDWFGRKARAFIVQNNFKFVDGFGSCGLTMSDFFVHDGHPNATGYGKISRCVERAVEEAFEPH
jgi:hypothetical protein